MTIARDLLRLTEMVESRIGLPPVRTVCIPPGVSGRGPDGEFGVVALADGSAGFFFALLGDTLGRLHREVVGAGASGRTVSALAAGIQSTDMVERAVALGTISAATQHLFQRARWPLPPAASSLGGMQFEPTDQVGMVGLFPSLARRLRERGIPLTVIELRPDKVQQAENFEVTLDPTRLAGCNKVLCTASTLINGTLETMLGHCSATARVALVGPTASCFPDPLFQRGVHVIGGSVAVDAAQLTGRVARGERWGDSVRRYSIDARDYPGIESLLERC